MIPVSPRTRRQPGRPEHFRTLLVVYSIRHALGVGLFAYLTWLALGVGSFGMIMALLTLVYAGSVVYGWFRLHGQYRRSRDASKAKTA